jgi:hypothetical protein
MIENRKNYRLDVDKIKTIKDVKNVLDNLHLIGYYDADDPNDENYYLSEYFTIPQERQGLTFSTPHKTLDEISQELDEKFEKLIEQTKRNFNASKLTGERNYEREFDTIIGNFEYAVKNGVFPQKIKWVMGTGLSALDGSYLVSNGGNFTPSFVVKQGSNHKGYYTIGNQRYFKYYMPEKPTAIVRFFMKVCLGFFWIDEVL